MAKMEELYGKRGALPGPLRTYRATDVVQIENGSGDDLDFYDILGVDGPLLTPTENEGEWLNQPTLVGSTPTTAHAGRMAILLEPAVEGRIARAVVSGVCQARVRMLSESHRLADVDPGATGQLLSGTAGAVQILWAEPVEDRVDPTIARAVVRIGGAGADAGRLNARVIAWQAVRSSGGVAYMWKYRPQLVTVHPTTFDLVADENDPWADWPDTFALNTLEFANIPQHTGRQGDDVDQTGDYPSTMFMEPIGGGAAGVPIRQRIIHPWLGVAADGSPMWFFHAYPGHNGACE